MNNISDYEARKRDEQYEIDNAAKLDRQWRDAAKCPIHHTPLVLGVGICGKTKVFGPRGGCAECFYQTEEWREMVKGMVKR